MHVSSYGRKLITEFEGKRLTAYQDSVGIWTIGVGHTAVRGAPKPVKGMVITSEECDRILSDDLVYFEDKVNEIVKVPLNQNQFDALVSICLNIGEGALAKSTLVRKLNAGDYKGAADQFLVWNKAGGKVLGGLSNRRAKEKALFLAPVPAIKPVEPSPEPTKEVPATPVPETKKSLWMVFLELLVKLFGK